MQFFFATYKFDQREVMCCIFNDDNKRKQENSSLLVSYTATMYINCSFHGREGIYYGVSTHGYQNIRNGHIGQSPENKHGIGVKRYKNDPTIDNIKIVTSI